MRSAICLTLAAVSLLSGCYTPYEPSEAEAEVAAQDLGLITATPIDGWDVYGGDVSDAAPVTLEALLSTPDQYAGQTLVVEGEVGQACPKKGCWMTMDAGDEQLRVTFVDYSFFVPIDSAGRTARFEGRFEITEISEADAKHYLEDAGDFEAAAAIEGPQPTYALVATGVRMRD
ncbi:MAG: DUF4920 domain-containing protein [Planctomycetota bacterium]|jgi:hypothetical protein